MLSRSSDTYLSAKVKTALLSDEAVKSNTIKVVSEAEFDSYLEG